MKHISPRLIAATLLSAGGAALAENKHVGAYDVLSACQPQHSASGRHQKPVARMVIRAIWSDDGFVGTAAIEAEKSGMPD